MDQYISLFEELATEADYDLDSKPVMNLFQRGLNNRLNNRIFSFDPQHRDWDDLKRHATLASNAEANIHQQIVQMLTILNLAYMNLITYQLIFDLRYFLPSMSSSLKLDSK